jgi:hypothetical protein
VGAPEFEADPAGQVMCAPGRRPRISVDVVVVGPGTAPGQFAPLLDAVDAILPNLPPTWFGNGNATPGEYQGAPCYVLPLISD